MIHTMRSLLSRLIVLFTYLFSRIFFRFELSWVQEPETDAWKQIRVFAFMNHTSLLEPLFFGAFPFSFFHFPFSVLWFWFGYCPVRIFFRSWREQDFGSFFPFLSSSHLLVRRYYYYYYYFNKHNSFSSTFCR